MGRPKGSINKSKDDELKTMFTEEEVSELIGKINREWNDKIDQLSIKVNQLVEVVNALTNKVLADEKTIETKQEVKQEKQPVEEPMPTDTVPIPPSWIKKVHDILQPDFGVKIIESARGDYIIDIYLPDKYKRDPQIKGQDHSTGLIKRATAIQDVESWCVKIRDNIKKYHPDFKA